MITGNAATMHVMHMPRVTHMSRDPAEFKQRNLTRSVAMRHGEHDTDIFMLSRPLVVSGLPLCLAEKCYSDLVWPQPQESNELLCSVTESKAYCGFAIAVRSDVLANYSSYSSLAGSFWSAKSETISIVSSWCPQWWTGPGQSERDWINQIIAHAKC
ncbi:hypothetical protein BKA67DRAFT_576524 [Truncatella angustata]|uniref:DUF7735 domain-containing protein n=1 Tax=Truncatella angustata TaxID=152316 RepID=A0A9P8UFM7_9PEZI|nr:uncharacterized protein BKA67DRAFT_576524 [Truncatella angustata]KAH6649000.1 hypothetical protein BKA67DRAFT_576524 [Truncatella angustata]